MFYSKRILKKKLACKTESVLKDKDNLDIANWLTALFPPQQRAC